MLLRYLMFLADIEQTTEIRQLEKFLPSHLGSNPPPGATVTNVLSDLCVIRRDTVCSSVLEGRLKWVMIYFKTPFLEDAGVSLRSGEHW